MSTAAAAEEKLSPAAIEAIRSHVEAGADYSDELADAGVLAGEYRVPKTRYDSRHEKGRIRTEVVPQLEAEASRLAEEARIAQEAAVPLDSVFVEQFRLLLSAIAHRRPSPAALDLLTSLSFVVPDETARKVEAAKAAARIAQDTRKDCEQYLVQTSSVPPDPEAQALASRLEKLAAQAEKAREDIAAAKRIPTQRQLVRQIAAGQVSPDMAWHLRHPGNPAEADRVFLSEARNKLAELNAINVPAAEATIARCEKEAADARTRLAELAEQRRQQQLRPESMSWQPEA